MYDLKIGFKLSPMAGSGSMQGNGATFLLLFSVGLVSSSVSLFAGSLFLRQFGTSLVSSLFRQFLASSLVNSLM
jgi:hypothetical protein